MGEDLTGVTEEEAKPKPIVGIVMGSFSDEPTMAKAAQVLQELGIPFEIGVVSAHRTPDEMIKYAKKAQLRGLRVIIAGAGGAAHLPGMIASETTLPVIGVPIKTEALGGQDSLFSIVQMPPGVPVATMAIGGAENAGLFAAEILALQDEKLAAKLITYKEELKAKVDAMGNDLATRGYTQIYIFGDSV